jgi:hypothetical protein
MQPKSIWGDVDFKALARETEAAHLLKSEVVSEILGNDEDLRSNLEQKTELAVVIDTGDERQVEALVIAADQSQRLSKIKFRRKVTLQTRWQKSRSVGHHEHPSVVKQVPGLSSRS